MLLTYYWNLALYNLGYFCTSELSFFFWNTQSEILHYHFQEYFMEIFPHQLELAAA